MKVRNQPNIKITPIDTLKQISVSKDSVDKEPEGHIEIYVIEVPSKLLELDCITEIAGFNLCYLYILSNHNRDQRYIDLAIKRLSVRMYQELLVFKDLNIEFLVNIKFPLASAIYSQLIRTESSLIASILEKYIDTSHSVDEKLYSYLTKLNDDVGNYDPSSISIRSIYRIDIDDVISPWHRLATSLLSVAKIVEEHINPIYKVIGKHKIDSLEKYLVGRYDPYNLIRAPQGKVIKNVKTYVRHNIFIEESDSDSKSRSSLVSKLSSSVGVSKKMYDTKSGRIVVLKRFNDPSNLKWIIMSPAVEMLKMIGIKLTISSTQRFWNEYSVWLNNSVVGFRIPRILYIDPWELAIVREYIAGKDLVQIIEEAGSKRYIVDLIKEIIESIAKTHKRDICFGDSKPDNFIVDNENNIYIIDLEQISKCNNNTHKAWDIVSFIYYISFMVSEKKATVILEELDAIIKSYYRINSDRGVAKEISNSIFPSIMVSLALINPSRSYLMYKYYRRLLSISKEIY